MDNMNKHLVNQDLQSENDEISKIINSGDIDAIKAVIVGLKKRIKANDDRASAVNILEKSSEMPESWKKNSERIAVEKYKSSELLKRESEILVQKSSLINRFSLCKNDSELFGKELNSLIRTGYFTNLDSSEYELLEKYLMDVFLVNGINDVAESLLKSKNVSIEYSKKPIVKGSHSVENLCAGLTTFHFNSGPDENVLLDLSNIKIDIWDKLDQSNKDYVKYHEYTHILLQPLNQVCDEKTIEKDVDDYVTKLLEGTKKKI